MRKLAEAEVRRTAAIEDPAERVVGTQGPSSADVRSALAEAAELKQYVILLQARLQQAQETHPNMPSIAAMAEKEVAFLRSQHRNLQKKLEVCQAQLQETELELQSVQAQMEVLQAELQQKEDGEEERPLFSTQASADAVQLQELRHVVSETREDNKRLARERDKLMEISNQLRSELKSLHSKSTAFQEQDLEALRAKEQDLEAKFQSKLDEFQATVKDLVMQNRQLKRDLRDATQEGAATSTDVRPPHLNLQNKVTAAAALSNGHARDFAPPLHSLRGTMRQQPSPSAAAALHEREYVTTSGLSGLFLSAPNEQEEEGDDDDDVQGKGFDVNPWEDTHERRGEEGSRRVAATTRSGRWPQDESPDEFVAASSSSHKMEVPFSNFSYGWGAMSLDELSAPVLKTRQATNHGGHEERLRDTDNDGGGDEVRRRGTPRSMQVLAARGEKERKRERVGWTTDAAQGEERKKERKRERERESRLDD
jgi:hypothetical protein